VVNPSGIYQIHCQRNGRRYVGKSENIPRRWQQHRRELDSGRHCCDRLQADWNHYGARAFAFSVVEYCHPWLMSGKEAYWIKRMGDYNEQRPQVPRWVLLANAIALLLPLLGLIAVLLLL
jgi:group I intron endonuclease